MHGWIGLDGLNGLEGLNGLDGYFFLLFKLDGWSELMDWMNGWIG